MAVKVLPFHHSKSGESCRFLLKSPARTQYVALTQETLQRAPPALCFGSGSARCVHVVPVNSSADAPSNVTTQLRATAQDTAATPE